MERLVGVLDKKGARAAYVLELAPATRSTTRIKNPNRALVSELTGIVDALERKMASAEACLVPVSQLAGHPGRRFRRKIVTILQRWPSDYFKRLHLAGKL